LTVIPLVLFFASKLLVAARLAIAPVDTLEQDLVEPDIIITVNAVGLASEHVVVVSDCSERLSAG